VAALKSEDEARFLRHSIAQNEDFAHDFWMGACALPAMPKQARHALNAAVLALVTSRVEAIEAGELIDLAAEHIDDPLFHDFAREPDVRAGLRSLVADARAAGRNYDIPAVSHLLQTILLMPMHAVSPLTLSVREAALSYAARIGSEAVTSALMHPRATAPPERGDTSPARPPSQGPISNYLLDSQRVLAGEPTSRPVSGAPKVIMGIIGFIFLAIVLNALDATCARAIR